MVFLKFHIEQIIAQYTGFPPLSIFLKHYYKHYPKLGSRDRRCINEAVFTYYRYARQVNPYLSNVWDVLRYAQSKGVTLSIYLENILNQNIADKIDEPIHFNSEFYDWEMSAPLTVQQFYLSIWKQPKLFIRILKNKEKNLKQLEKKNIPYQIFNNIYPIGNAYGLDNGVKLQTIINDDDYLVQDYSSQLSVQKAISALPIAFTQGNIQVWDTCCGAGGKSILLRQILPKAQITATDIRHTILNNFKFRLKKLGFFQQIEVLNLDTTQKKSLQKLQRDFDIILCDVPCTGSGTWSRTPEQFYFFNKEKINDFVELQRNIVQNAIIKLKKDGFLIYITCSVFKEENEKNIEHFLAGNELKLVTQELITGHEQEADHLFLSVLQKL